jgi:hypothetical protein
MTALCPAGLTPRGSGFLLVLFAIMMSPERESMSVSSDLTSLELVNPGTQAYAYARVTVRNSAASRNAVTAAISSSTTWPPVRMTAGMSGAAPKLRLAHPTCPVAQTDAEFDGAHDLPAGK